MSYEVRLQSSYRDIKQRLAGDGETTIKAINLATSLQNAQETIFRRLRGIEEELIELDTTKTKLDASEAKVKALEFRVEEMEKELHFNKQEKSLNAPHYPHISLRDIIAVVCAAHNIESEIITSKLHTKEVSHIRFIIVYVARSLGKQDRLIGKWLGDRDSSTIRHAYLKMKKLIHVSPVLHAEIDDYRKKLLASNK